MSDNPYEFLATKNAVLVRFLDANPEISKAVMKMIRMIVRVCEEKHWSAPDLTYEVKSPRECDEIICVELKKKGV